MHLNCWETRLGHGNQITSMCTHRHAHALIRFLRVFFFQAELGDVAQHWLPCASINFCENNVKTVLDSYANARFWTWICAHEGTPSVHLAPHVHTPIPRQPYCITLHTLGNSLILENTNDCQRATDIGTVVIVRGGGQRIRARCQSEPI